MFSSARSIIATLILSTIVVGTPPLAGSESWADFFRDLFSIADYESMIEDENKLTDKLNRKDAVILNRLAAKNKVIDALAEKKSPFYKHLLVFISSKNKPTIFSKFMTTTSKICLMKPNALSIYFIGPNPA